MTTLYDTTASESAGSTDSSITGTLIHGGGAEHQHPLWRIPGRPGIKLHKYLLEDTYNSTMEFFTPNPSRTFSNTLSKIRALSIAVNSSPQQLEAFKSIQDPDDRAFRDPKKSSSIRVGFHQPHRVGSYTALLHLFKITWYQAVQKLAERMIPFDNRTRWNSWYPMIQA